MSKILKLPQDIVNQIAAGEVIERPSSVVKELLDNAIDSGAEKIKIRIKSGGKRLIEVSDNGSGIDGDMLEQALEPHATSKIVSLEDLNSLMTLGFRGEALSTIASVAKVTIASKSENQETAKQITSSYGEKKEITDVARDTGTTVTVEDLFEEIPARMKFLKSDETEYRKIIETVTPYLVLHPEIHFTLEKDGRVIYNLPRIEGASAGQLVESRISEVNRGDFVKDMVTVFSDGAGIKVVGLVAHPRHHSQRPTTTQMFVNNRPIYDKGLYRSVLSGYGRFIPHGEKVPFLLNIVIEPHLVDVNVHPRKEEVRFMNPYRVFTAVEDAIKAALESEVKNYNENGDMTISSDMDSDEIAYNRLRASGNVRKLKDQRSQFESSFLKSPTEIRFNKPSRSTQIQNSLNFSKSIISDSSDGEADHRDSGVISEFRSVHQVFNKYIIAEMEEEMWVIDQHAAAERISFERLKNNIKKGADIQELLVPTHIPLEDSEISYVNENIGFFEKIGFGIKTVENGVLITAVPSEFTGVPIENVFKAIFELTDQSLDLANNFKKAQEDILATVACHTSIRSKQRLDTAECESLIRQLMACKNSYSCPHGRPIVWRMSLTEIDKNFDRTY
ncbi:DNA mismatch repair endonuclease MutL [Candidatus Dojkabacteria bacterium]|uniref:DNA mismatch repair protein MutL n=1 Tax=Candidatus Dojkabacteria bacterium TaxID=2099670 RepID=A0A955HZK3_9BACT|nr:DNA mismatch repair endonuclease MutL [Candidatus Dojkabacteria bacterium]